MSLLCRTSCRRRPLAPRERDAVLTASLQQEIGSPDKLAQLVDQDFYQADAWKIRLDDLAGNDEEALEGLIPPAYAGATTADRRDATSLISPAKCVSAFPPRSSDG